jgi:FKBP-type peptidyl-prolyl cis-trans isomerase 2
LLKTPLSGFEGDTVSVKYTCKNEKGRILDTTCEPVAREAGIYNPERAYLPLCISVGAGQVIKGFDLALMGMKKGEKKTVKILPEEGYGGRNEELKKAVNLKVFLENNLKPVLGMKITSGERLGEIVEINDREVILDFNHSLAGRTLIFDIKIEDLTKAK